MLWGGLASEVIGGDGSHHKKVVVAVESLTKKTPSWSWGQTSHEGGGMRFRSRRLRLRGPLTKTQTSKPSTDRVRVMGREQQEIGAASSARPTRVY